MKNKKNIKVFLLVFGIIVLVFLAIYFLVLPNFARENNHPLEIPTSWIFETQEVKEGEMVSFRYPKDFDSTYISPVDWPPSLYVLEDSPYFCLEAGSKIERAGRTEEREIGDKMYCITELEEGAAGSIYSSYAYNTVLNNKNIILTFSLRKPQCLNYDEPNKRACQEDQNNLDLDIMVEKIVSTIELFN